MFSTLITLALLAAPALAAFAVNTPTLTQCQDAKVSWDPSKAPYNLIVVSANDPCGEVVVDLGDHDSTFMTWKKVGLPAGYKAQLSLEDALGNEAWSGNITVQPSDDSSCIPANLVKPATSAQSSTKSTPVVGSTLVITPTTTVNAVAPQTTSSDTTPEAVGAAGANPLGLGNGAINAHYASTPALILGALAAILAASF